MSDMYLVRNSLERRNPMNLRTAALALATTAAVALTGCGSSEIRPQAASASSSAAPSSSSTPRTTARPVKTSATVKYLVRGTATSASVTMKTPTGTQQKSDIAVPLQTKSGETGLEFDFDYGEFVYVSAQNNGSTGTINCTIIVDGIILSTNQSSGAYAIATCDGST